MFDRLSIRHKLVVLLGLSAGLALLLSSLMTVYSTYVSETRASLRVLHQLTDVISENMRAALAFHDADSARNMLAPLHADPHILLALVSDEGGTLLAQYRSSSLSPERESLLQSLVQEHLRTHPVTVDDFVYHGDPQIMGVVHPIFFEERPIGTFVVISDTERLWAQLGDFVWVQLLTSSLTLLVLVLLSWRLQSVFTRPIVNLIETMQDVAQTKDYGVVLTSQRNDEFRSLYDSFNAMLSDIRERDDRLSQLATTDALTGLANRHQAMLVMQQCVDQARLSGRFLGVILLDIDFFKKVNDRYGHRVGDLVLREVACVLQLSAGDAALVARLGGEEFLVLCEGVTPPLAVAVAERIRRAIEVHAIEYESGHCLHVTVSLGVHALVPAAHQPIEHIIELADAALYRAKDSGRNCHVLV